MEQDNSIWCDHHIEATRPNVTLKKENNDAFIADIASHGHKRVGKKEIENVQK